LPTRSGVSVGLAGLDVDGSAGLDCLGAAGAGAGELLLGWLGASRLGGGGGELITLPPAGGGYVGMENPGGGACGCAFPPGTKELAPGLKEKLFALGFRPLPLG